MKKQVSRNISKITTYIILSLGLLVFALPFWYMLITSLKPQAYIFEMPPKLWPSVISFSNYITALGKDSFGLYFLNSLFVAITATLATIIISAMLAYAFARLEFPGKEVIFYSLLLGMMIPPVMLIIPQFIIAKQLDLINRFLGLILVYITMNLSMQTFLLRNFFEGIPREIEEAALIDGASRLGIFWRIVLPLSKPGLAAVTIFTFLYSWDEFPWAHVAMKETTKRTLPIAIAFFQSQHLTEWGQVFAASIVSLIPIALVFIIFQRYFIQGISTTGVKG
ncbi:MAG: carbohydrate ABC transporter permease [Anaerolineaceae bacterium]|nr:carbohydrate ABC transporter permease [Anaerolineaceae bacterium]